MSEPRVTLDLVFAQGQRILEDTRLIREEQREQRPRLSAIEHELAHFSSEFARLDVRIDRIRDRLERIERRFDRSSPQE